MGKESARHMIEFTITMFIMTLVIQTVASNGKDPYLVVKSIDTLDVAEQVDLNTRQIRMI
ncbi:hypothetical protein ACSBR2_021542 [Camellia fascicularis]